jgi:hypothetical protein
VPFSKKSEYFIWEMERKMVNSVVIYNHTTMDQFILDKIEEGLNKVNQQRNIAKSTIESSSFKDVPIETQNYWRETYKTLDWQYDKFLELKDIELRSKED